MLSLGMLRLGVLTLWMFPLGMLCRCLPGLGLVVLGNTGGLAVSAAAAAGGEQRSGGHEYEDRECSGIPHIETPW
jgi:hypothetical protein